MIIRRKTVGASRRPSALHESATRKPAQRRVLTETQRNGQRTADAVKNWKKLLECTHGFSPIKNNNVKKTTAMLLENQMRWINEAATSTSIFGPQNGLTGGSLGSVDSYARGDFRLPRVLLPMVRRIYPALMSNETVGVQPMPGPTAMAYAIRYKYLKGPHAAGDSAVNHEHEQFTRPDGSTDWRAKGIKGVETKAALTPTAITDLYALQEACKEGATPAPTAEQKQLHAVAVSMGLLDPGKPLSASNGISIVNADLVLIDPLGFPVQQKVLATYNTTTKISITHPFGYQFNQQLAVGTSVKANVVGISVNHGDALKPGHVQDWNDHRYTGNDEMGYQRLDTRFTGRADARLAEPLANGRFVFRPEDTGVAAEVHQFEGTGAVARTSFGFEKCAVEAGTRRLSTSWTLETEEDLKNTNGIDIDTEATQQMSYELQAEIDREMTVRMLYSCLKHGEWSVWSGALADARWMGERARAFYQHLIKMSIRMRTRNRRGAANFILCTPDVAALLECLDEFIQMPVNSNVTTNNTASAAAGTLGGNRFNVFIDDRTPVYETSDYGKGYDGMFDPSYDNETYHMPNYCMLGYKGTEPHDAGIIYCPYIPIMVQTATDPYSFEPQVGLMTRYGVMDHIFGSHLYYHCIIIDSFSQAGLASEYSKLYPAGYAGQPEAGEEPNAGYAFPVHPVHVDAGYTHAHGAVTTPDAYQAPTQTSL